MNPMRQNQMRNNLVLFALLACLAFSSSSTNLATTQKASKQKQAVAGKDAGKVIILRNLDQLKADFQLDAGKIRLVTILSPT